MRRILLVAALWVLAVAAIAGNVVASLDGMGPLVQVTFGVIAIACVAGLVRVRVLDRRTRQPQS